MYLNFIFFNKVWNECWFVLGLKIFKWCDKIYGGIIIDLFLSFWVLGVVYVMYKFRLLGINILLCIIFLFLIIWIFVKDSSYIVLSDI